MDRRCQGAEIASTRGSSKTKGKRKRWWVEGEIRGDRSGTLRVVLNFMPEKPMAAVRARQKAFTYVHHMMLVLMAENQSGSTCFRLLLYCSTCTCPHARAQGLGSGYISRPFDACWNATTSLTAFDTLSISMSPQNMSKPPECSMIYYAQFSDRQGNLTSNQGCVHTQVCV